MEDEIFHHPSKRRNDDDHHRQNTLHDQSKNTNAAPLRLLPIDFSTTSDPVQLGVFNESHMRRMIDRRDITEGKPFSIHFGTGTVSCVIWTGRDVTILQKYLDTIKKMSELDTNNNTTDQVSEEEDEEKNKPSEYQQQQCSEPIQIYMKILDSHLSEDMSWVGFNRGSRHYPLKLAIEEIYGRSAFTSYCPLWKREQEDRFQDSNHNLYRIFQLLNGISKLFIQVDDADYPVPLFSDKLKVAEMVSLMEENLWIKDANVSKDRIIDENDSKYEKKATTTSNAHQGRKSIPPERETFLLSPFQVTTTANNVSSSWRESSFKKPYRPSRTDSSNSRTADALKRDVWFRIFRELGKKILRFTTPSSTTNNKSSVCGSRDHHYQTTHFPAIEGGPFEVLERILRFFSLCTSPRDHVHNLSRYSGLIVTSNDASCSSTTEPTRKPIIRDDIEHCPYYYTPQRRKQQPQKILHRNIYYSLRQVRDDTEKVLQWFESHAHWPQMLWNDMHSETSIRDERCMEIDCYNEDDLRDFSEKVDITGSSWWPEPEEGDKLFLSKPFLLMLRWQPGHEKLRCRIAFDKLVTVSCGNIVSESIRMEKIEQEHNRRETLKTVREIPNAFIDFCKEIHSLHESGRVLPKKLILERSMFYRDPMSKKLKFRMCMYNPVTFGKSLSSLLPPQIKKSSSIGTADNLTGVPYDVELGNVYEGPSVPLDPNSSPFTGEYHSEEFRTISSSNSDSASSSSSSFSSGLSCHSTPIPFISIRINHLYSSSFRRLHNNVYRLLDAFDLRNTLTATNNSQSSLNPPAAKSNTSTSESNSTGKDKPIVDDDDLSPDYWSTPVTTTATTTTTNKTQYNSNHSDNKPFSCGSNVRCETIKTDTEKKKCDTLERCKKQNTWELGVLVVCLYRYLLRRKKTEGSTSSVHSLSLFLHEFQATVENKVFGESDQQQQQGFTVKDNNNDNNEQDMFSAMDRMWIFPYKTAGWTFSLMMANVFTARVDKVPTVKEFYESKFTKKWVTSQDLYKCYVASSEDRVYELLGKEERNEFAQIDLNTSSVVNMSEDTVILESSWRDVRKMENAENVIRRFTHSLKQPMFNCTLQRNRHLLSVQFGSTVESIYEFGQGHGVVQEALTLYWMSIAETGIFSTVTSRKIQKYQLDRVGKKDFAPSSENYHFDDDDELRESTSRFKSKKNKRKNKHQKNNHGVHSSSIRSPSTTSITDSSVFIPTNVNSNHWFVLGLIMNHCMLNDYTFFIHQPPVFYKILLEGPDRQFDPCDMSHFSRKSAIHILNLFFTSDQYLQDVLCLDMDEFTEQSPFLSGQVTMSNLEQYMYEFCKRSVLNEYASNEIIFLPVSEQCIVYIFSISRVVHTNTDSS